jgi:hypothetical protein
LHRRRSGGRGIHHRRRRCRRWDVNDGEGGSHSYLLLHGSVTLLLLLSVRVVRKRIILRRSLLLLVMMMTVFAKTVRCRRNGGVIRVLLLLPGRKVRGLQPLLFVPPASSILCCPCIHHRASGEACHDTFRDGKVSRE